ncbi:MAG: hypothetical protein E6Q97_19730 [Desulfurellales bacterium]|nr:MAG: hypothetical protein E6Q97_19730 [Desulfurellales bacterium]
MRLSLPQFCSDAQYVAARPLLLNGIRVSQGETIRDVNARRMEQLFRARLIVPVSAVPTTPKLTPVSRVTETNKQQQQWKEKSYGKH